MKRYGMTGLCIVLFILFLIGTTVSAGIQGTKHDLSTSGSGNIRSAGASNTSGASQVCVFCHTPHRAAAIPSAPLWNKNFDPTTYAGYQPYTSDVLTALGYPAGETPVITGSKTVHVRTRLCLSCHDGTIALGSLANLPFGFSGDMPMIGTSGGYMPTTAIGYIGVDLRDDHPVAIKYTNAQDSELAAAPSGKVKVFNDSTTGNNYVECTSCHEPHDNTYTNFLVDSNAGSAICTNCHSNKSGYSSGVHATSTAAYNRQPIGTTVGGVKCMDCHFPHKAGITDTSQLPKANALNLTTYPQGGYYLLSFQEEGSCFNDTDRWGQTNVNACHGTNATATSKNIESLVAPTKYSGHWVGNYNGLHLATEAQASVVGGWAGANIHVECQDCHNPHTAGNTNHAKGTNQVGGSTRSLYGTGGVTPSSWPAWNPGISTGSYTPVQPTGVTSTTSNGVTYEYEICLKCHSDFAWNPATPPNSPTAGGTMSNQAMEFGNNATSSHPVAFANGNNQGTYVAPWTANGGQTMYCSDCHNNDAGAPNGPHGSNARSILYQNFNPNTVGQGVGDLCYACHAVAAYSTGNNPAQTGFSGAGNNLHYQHMSAYAYSGGVQKSCTNCHVNPTHGSNKLNLISYQTDPAPYGQYSYMKVFTQNTGAYVKANCSAFTCHNGATHP